MHPPRHVLLEDVQDDIEEEHVMEPWWRWRLLHRGAVIVGASLVLWATVAWMGGTVFAHAGSGTSTPCHGSCLGLQEQVGPIRARADALPLHIAADLITQNVRRTHWQVIFPKGLPIRARRSRSSEIRGLKEKCSVVVGHEEGGWVKLLQHDESYMKIKLPKTQTLLLREVGSAKFQKISSGSCHDVGKFSILDPYMCRVAAHAVGLPQNLSMHVQHERLLRRHFGCHIIDDESTDAQSLLLGSPFTSNTTASATVYQRLCSSKEPCHPHLKTFARSITTASRTTGTRISSSISTPTTTNNATKRRRISRTTAPATTTTTTWTSTSTAATWEWPSLFCFSVLMSDGYERELVEAQYERRVSIFACDEFAVVSLGANFTVGSIEALGVPIEKPMKKGKLKEGDATTSWLNTEVFMAVWVKIEMDSRYRKHDWVVKVDPDAVFFPERLRDLVRPVSKDGPSLYVTNCDRFADKGWSTFFGSVEILSKAAVDAYLWGWKRCKLEMKWWHWGEDLYISRCMDLLGVGHIDRWDVLGDTRCRSASCYDQSKIAYHDYKNTSSYFTCWDQSSPDGERG